MGYINNIGFPLQYNLGILVGNKIQIILWPLGAIWAAESQGKEWVQN